MGQANASFPCSANNVAFYIRRTAVVLYNCSSGPSSIRFILAYACRCFLHFRFLISRVLKVYAMTSLTITSFGMWKRKIEYIWALSSSYCALSQKSEYLCWFMRKIITLFDMCFAHCVNCQGVLILLTSAFPQHVVYSPQWFCVQLMSWCSLCSPICNQSSTNHSLHHLKTRRMKSKSV